MEHTNIWSGTGPVKVTLMRLGLSLPQFGAHCDPSTVASFARGAEELGYRSLWVADRVLTPVRPSDIYPSGTAERPYPPEFTTALDPLVVLTAAAVATSRARLGTSALIAPWHSPLLLGRALTTLDALSGGRLDAGFGIGWMRDEYAAVAVPWRRRGLRLEEILDVLHALWTANPVEHHGERFGIPPSWMDLRPVQPGGPPVLLAGRTPPAMRRIGRRAAGWLPVAGPPTGLLEQLWQTARRAAAETGRDPDNLRRELRINATAGQRPASLLRLADQAHAQGYDGAFFDVTTAATRSVGEALDLADKLITALGQRA